MTGDQSEHSSSATAFVGAKLPPILARLSARLGMESSFLGMTVKDSNPP